MSEDESRSSSSVFSEDEDEDLEDVPLFLSSEAARNILSSSSSAAPAPSAMPSMPMKLPGMSGCPNDGSCTARPSMGKLQLGPLAARQTDTQPTPAFQQRQRGGESSEQDVASTTTSRHRNAGMGEQVNLNNGNSSIPSFHHLLSSSADQHQSTSRQRTAIPSLALGRVRPQQEPDCDASTSGSLVNNKHNNSWGPSQSVAVSLLSYAFLTSTPPSEEASTSGSISALHDGIAQRISSQLGVRPQDLRLFDLKEIESSRSSSSGGLQGQKPQHHVAALVSNSGFSLAALEEMLAWNQQLQTMQCTHAQTIATMQLNYKDATTENKRLALECAAKDRELERLQEQVRKADADAEAMRLALQQGEEQRQQLVSVISMLKQEFLSLRSVIGGEPQ